MVMLMSYEEYLIETRKSDCRYSWIDWKTDICGMSYFDAIKAANDPEWGYEE